MRIKKLQVKPEAFFISSYSFLKHIYTLENLQY